MLADVSADLFNDGPGAIASSPGGEVLLAWAKDGDLGLGEAPSVVVA